MDDTNDYIKNWLDGGGRWTQLKHAKCDIIGHTSGDFKEVKGCVDLMPREI